MSLHSRQDWVKIESWASFLDLSGCRRGWGRRWHSASRLLHSRRKHNLQRLACMRKDNIPWKDCNLESYWQREKYLRVCPIVVWLLPQPQPSLLHWPRQDTMTTDNISCSKYYWKRSKLKQPRAYVSSSTVKGLLSPLSMCPLLIEQLELVFQKKKKRWQNPTVEDAAL